MFNEHVHREWQRPHHRGIPDAFEGNEGEENLVLGQIGFPGEGPYMKIALQLEDRQIQAAWFQTYSCPVAVACGSRLVRWLENKTPEQAQTIEVKDLEVLLGGLPPGKEHCSVLTIQALRSALSQVPTDPLSSSH